MFHCCQMCSLLDKLCYKAINGARCIRLAYVPLLAFFSLECHRICYALLQISEAVVKLELKKKDIAKLLETDNLLWKEFKESIGDSKFAEYLTKVYKKRIRRSKKKASNRPGM